MATETQNFHDSLTAALAVEGDDALTTVLADARAADIAQSFQLLSDEDRSRIIFALSPVIAAEVVGWLDEAVRSDVVDELDTESLTEIVSELPPDDAADILAELTEKEADEILEQLGDKQAEQIEELLEYGESTAGGIMTPDVIAVAASKTVADAVEYVRSASQYENLNEIYIVDDNRKLLGTVPLRKLVISAGQTKLEKLVEPTEVVVHANDDQETVLQTIRKYSAMEAAVVDEKNRLLGRITHDDVLDVAEEEAEEDLLRFAGTSAEELTTSSVFHAARIRLTWLLPCMIGMCLSATVLYIAGGHFEAAILALISPFVPMIGATGGNSGIQISTVIIRGFASGELGSTMMTRAFLREGRIAIAMAPVCGLVAWLAVTFGLPVLSSLSGHEAAPHFVHRVALAVGIAMTAAILVAAVLGILLPFTFRRLGVDPAIASGPLVTTMNDVVSVSIYMTVAMLIAR